MVSTVYKEGNDGLLYGLVGPLSPLADPVLKIRLQDRCGRTWYVTWYVVIRGAVPLWLSLVRVRSHSASR